MKAITVFCLLLRCLVISYSFTGLQRWQHPENKFSDSLSAERPRYTAAILKQLPGKENTSADSIFTNLKSVTGKASVNVRQFLA